MTTIIIIIASYTITSCNTELVTVATYTHDMHDMHMYIACTTYSAGHTTYLYELLHCMTMHMQYNNIIIMQVMSRENEHTWYSAYQLPDSWSDLFAAHILTVLHDLISCACC